MKRTLLGIALVLCGCGTSDDTLERDPQTQPPAGDGATDPGPSPSDPGPGQPPEEEPEDDPDVEEEVRLVLLVPGTMITGDYFDDMAERLEADGFEPVIYETPDLLTDSLAIGAQRIADEVDEVLAAHGADKLHVVAECNGGVATRYFLQVLGGHDRVAEVVTFVSAHHGTWLSPVGDGLTGFQSLADITPGSNFLDVLNSAPFPEGLGLTSIYTCNDELMLPYDTSVVDGATNVLFCDHYIGHLDGFWDAVVYERIRLALAGEGASAPTQY